MFSDFSLTIISGDFRCSGLGGEEIGSSLLVVTEKPSGPALKHSVTECLFSQVCGMVEMKTVSKQ